MIPILVCFQIGTGIYRSSKVHHFNRKAWPILITRRVPYSGKRRVKIQYENVFRNNSEKLRPTISRAGVEP